MKFEDIKENDRFYYIKHNVDFDASMEYYLIAKELKFVERDYYWMTDYYFTGDSEPRGTLRLFAQNSIIKNMTPYCSFGELVEL